jgi:predicted nucleotidyltransferase
LINILSQGGKILEIHDRQRQVLTDIKNVVASLKLNILFVGAGARIFILDTQYNIERRATKDLDFAAQVNNR